MKLNDRDSVLLQSDVSNPEATAVITKCKLRPEALAR